MSSADRKASERKLYQKDQLLEHSKNERSLSRIMTDANFYQCMEEITMTYIMADFHKQSLCKQWLAMMKVVKKKADKTAGLVDINDVTMKIFKMVMPIIYPGYCHCNGTDEKKAKSISIEARINAIHLSLDPIWVWSGNKGFNLTRLILEYDIDFGPEILQYSFEHILSSPDEVKEIYVELILEIANPTERVKILTDMGFIGYLDKRVKDLMNMPKCEYPSCGWCSKQGKMMRCKGCQKIFCNAECQKKHHRGKKCVTLGKC